MMTLIKRVQWSGCALLAAVLVAGGWLAGRAADDKKSEFARATIDLGVVASDVDKSVKFYKDAIGFEEIQGFSVGADFCAQAGLTDRRELSIHVLVLEDSPAATRLKLMSVPGAANKKSDNAFIHAQLGYRYLTIYVANLSETLLRLKKAGAAPIGKAPVPLPKDLSGDLALVVVRDPDGNMVELIGPLR